MNYSQKGCTGTSSGGLNVCAERLCLKGASSRGQVVALISLCPFMTGRSVLMVCYSLQLMKLYVWESLLNVHDLCDLCSSGITDRHWTLILSHDRLQQATSGSQPAGVAAFHWISRSDCSFPGRTAPSVCDRPGCGPDWSSVVSGLFLLEELVKVQFVKTSSHDPSVPEYFQASLSSEKDICVKQYNGFSQDENRGLRSPEKMQQMLVLPFCVLQTRTDSIHTFTVGFLSW